MCDSIEGMLGQSSSMIEIRNPLSRQYTFHCYLHVQEKQHSNNDDKSDNNNSSNSTINNTSDGNSSSEDDDKSSSNNSGRGAIDSIKLTLKTPVNLCSRQRLSPLALQKSLAALMVQLSPLFLRANISDPFNMQQETEANNEYADALFVDTTDKKSMQDFLQIVNIRTFEANLQRNSRAIRASAFQPATKELKKQTWALLNDEAEAFIRGGHVMVKGLSAVDEYESIEKLRQFIFDYGANINFSVAQWNAVVIMLYEPVKVTAANPAGKTSTSNQGSSNGSHSASSSSDSGSNNPKISKGARKSKDFTGYRCVKEGRIYLLEIPYKFRVSTLLEFIRVSLPMSCLVADYTR